MPSSYLNHYSDNQARVNEQAILVGGQNAISASFTGVNTKLDSIIASQGNSGGSSGTSLNQVLCPYTSNGGTGGIFWALGTQGGLTAYVNPASAKIRISLSTAGSNTTPTISDRSTTTNLGADATTYYFKINIDKATRKIAINRLTFHVNLVTGVTLEGSNNDFATSTLLLGTAGTVANWNAIALAGDVYYSHYKLAFTSLVRLNEIEAYGWISNF